MRMYSYSEGAEFLLIVSHVQAAGLLIETHQENARDQAAVQWNSLSQKKDNGPAFSQILPPPLFHRPEGNLSHQEREKSNLCVVFSLCDCSHLDI